MKDNVINAQERFEARRTGPTMLEHMGYLYDRAMIRLGSVGQPWNRPDAENYHRGRRRLFTAAVAATTLVFGVHVIDEHSERKVKLAEIQACVTERQPAGADLRVQDLQNGGSGEGPQYFSGYAIGEGENYTNSSLEAARIAGQVLRICLEDQ